MPSGLAKMLISISTLPVSITMLALVDSFMLSGLTQKLSDRRCKRLTVSQERPRTAQPLTRRNGAAVRCSALVSEPTASEAGQ